MYNNEQEKLRKFKEGRELLNPKNDYVFKRIFGYKGNENITKDFLNSVIDDEVEEVDLEHNRILEKDLEEDKVCVLDIRAKINKNIDCDIEMQIVDRKDIKERALFYWSRLFSQSISLGEPYLKLNKAIVIFITDFEVEGLEEVNCALSKWELRGVECPEIVLTNKMELYILELPKAEKYGNIDENLERWVKFIKKPEALNMDDMEKNKNVKQAMDELKRLSADEHERELAYQRMLRVIDDESIREAGYDAGKKEEKIEIVKNMIKKGIDDEVIIECTEISKEQLEEIKNKK